MGGEGKGGGSRGRGGRGALLLLRRSLEGGSAHADDQMIENAFCCFFGLII